MAENEGREGQLRWLEAIWLNVPKSSDPTGDLQEISSALSRMSLDTPGAGQRESFEGFGGAELAATIAMQLALAPEPDVVGTMAAALELSGSERQWVLAPLVLYGPLAGFESLELTNEALSSDEAWVVVAALVGLCDAGIAAVNSGARISSTIRDQLMVILRDAQTTDIAALAVRVLAAFEERSADVLEQVRRLAGSDDDDVREEALFFLTEVPDRGIGDLVAAELRRFERSGLGVELAGQLADPSFAPELMHIRSRLRRDGLATSRVDWALLRCDAAASSEAELKELVLARKVDQSLRPGDHVVVVGSYPRTEMRFPPSYSVRGAMIWGPEFSYPSPGSLDVNLVASEISLRLEI